MRTLARHLRTPLLASIAFLLSSAAHARDLAVTVKDADGRPVADAVVILDVPGRIPPPSHFRIDQKDKTFRPFVLVVPVGSTVDFTNLDPFRHHVYSFSSAKKFELKLFGQGEKRSVVLDRPGTVAIGCNIHDTMQAFIQVVDMPFAAKTGNDGRVLFRGAPASRVNLRVWHPRLRSPGNQLEIAAASGGDIVLPVKVRLRRPAPMMHGY